MRKLLYLLLTSFTFCTTISAEERLTAYRLTSENGLPDNNIRYIKQDSTGFLKMISLYEAYQYDGYNFRKLPHDTFLQLKEERRRKLQGGKGYIYDNKGNKILTEKGNTITYIDKNTGERIDMEVFNDQLRQLSRDLKCMVITDREGYIWVSVNGNGLFIYNRQKHQLYHITKTDDTGLIDANAIIYMLEDAEGNIWVSQEHYGLVCLKKVRTPYNIVNIGDNNSSEKENEIRNLKRLDDGSILVSNRRGRLMRTDGNLRKEETMQQRGDNYNSAALDDQGRLWLGSLMRGINIDGKWYGSGRVDYILKDTKGRMWTCSLDGALTQATLDDNGRFSERTFLTDIEKLGARSLLQDHKGAIWLGSDKGLFTFFPDQLLKNPKDYRKVSDLPIRTLAEDSSHRLWIGTAGMGLGTIEKDGSIRLLNREDGLPNNVVQFIVEDSHHNLSIGTEDGCINMSPESGVLHSLYFNDNKNRNYYNVDCAVQLDDGRMAFGSLDGIIVVDKDIQSASSQHGRTHITDLLINGVSVYDMKDKSPVEGDVSQASTIDLQHNQNVITLYFSNFDYGKSHLAQYSYKLEGYDQKWNMLTDINYVTYKDLSPGTYTFLVRYRDIGGWSEEEQVVTIEIHPALWATWWAYLLYILGAIVVGYVIFQQVRSTNRLRQRIAIEKQLTEYKLRFFTNISHEFRTPLTLIQGAMERINQVKDIPGNMKQPLSNMQQSTNRMLRLINQLLEFRRLQNNKQSLSLVETDVIQFVYDIYIGFHDFADNQRISYTFMPFQKSYTMCIDRGHVDKIIYNLLSNAFKYTPERGSIMVNIREAEGNISISVTDTGIGISEEKEKELFDRFSTDRVRGDSIGIGLNMSQELARIHHGAITYQHNEPVGSIFTLTLPTDKSVYQEKDFMRTNVGLQEEKQEERKGFTNAYREIKSNPLNDRRILVVEDDHELAVMIQDELSTYFEVDRVSNGAEALEKLKETTEQESSGYDLVVSDVMMPRMGGFELTRIIRADKRLSELPIILLTALTGEEQQQKGLTIGADAYLEKPFSPKVLTAQAINLIEQRDRLKATYSTQTQKPVVKELVKNDTDKRFVMQLDMYIENHLSDYNLSVDAMAEHFHFGRTRFYNKVRAITGKTPNEYLKEKRLIKAAELLRESEAITVAEVAYRIGISNAQYMAVNFKKMFGVTPSSYQKGEHTDNERDSV